MSSEATRRCSCFPCVENRIDTTSFRSPLTYCTYARRQTDVSRGGFISNDRTGECLVIVRARGSESEREERGNNGEKVPWRVCLFASVFGERRRRAN
jgi:hypothetical protein